MSLRKEEIAETIEYPSSDGEPMAETDTHIKLMMNLRFTLSQFFRNREDVYIGSNLLIYYVEGDTRKRVAPDVFVVRGVGKHDRRVYKLWEEGRAPDVVIELSSRQTWGEDLQKKWRLYEQLGVKEYYIFDPEYDYLPSPLLAYKLREGQYEQIEVENGRIASEELGLELVDTGETLRLYDPRAGAFLPTADEETDARIKAEEALRQSREEVARLNAELEKMRREDQN
ncbi:MAG TPA: Uma2 family endonuclease [Blastocatellia bacterium]